MLRGKDVHDIEGMNRMGLSISAISELTHFDRKTVRKYLLRPEAVPEYGGRAVGAGKLEPFKAYLEDRLKAGVWNAQVLLRELREQGYAGGYTILKDWLHPQRQAAYTTAVRRFETPPGKQAQVDWGHLGYLQREGVPQKIWGFTITLGYSRRMWAEASLEQTLGTLLRMHEATFTEWGGVPEEILYDRMKTVWLDVDDRGEIIWHPMFLDFARYWGFQPRLCRPYRAQTKGKIESGVKYVRRNFVCGLLGREPSCLPDFNTQLRQWVGEVANVRVHGTTHEEVSLRWQREQAELQPVNGRRAYPASDDHTRKVARDAYVSWNASRYSVPWAYAGREVWVRERDGAVEVHCDGERIATHPRAARKHDIITEHEHHRGIPLNAGHGGGKILVRFRDTAPTVEARPLAAYESVAIGGIR